MKSEQQRKDEYLAQNNPASSFDYVKMQLPIWLNDMQTNYNNYSETGLKPVSDNDLLALKFMLEEILNEVELEKEDRGL